jgi:hypothetical protein
MIPYLVTESIPLRVMQDNAVALDQCLNIPDRHIGHGRAVMRYERSSDAGSLTGEGALGNTSRYLPSIISSGSAAACGEDVVDAIGCQ